MIGIALGSDAPIGIGMAHGWHRLDPPMIITKSSGSRIYEIDDEPALDVMLRRNGAEGGRAADIFRYPETLQLLGLSRRSGEDIRALVTGDDEDRSIWGGADFPQGALCWLMGGDHDSLINGRRRFVREALGRTRRPAAAGRPGLRLRRPPQPARAGRHAGGGPGHAARPWATRRSRASTRRARSPGYAARSAPII